MFVIALSSSACTRVPSAAANCVFNGFSASGTALRALKGHGIQVAEDDGAKIAWAMVRPLKASPGV
jgi:hypothetical protein